MKADTLPPHDLAMEQAIIGCILQKPETADECAMRFKVGGDVFFDLKNREIYCHLMNMRGAGTPIDSATVFSHFKAAGMLDRVGGMVYLSECEARAVSVANFEFYADKVGEVYTLRKAVAACTEAVASVYSNQESAETVITGIEAKLASLRDMRGSDEIVSSKRAADLMSLHLEQRFNLQGKKSGIETGLYQLDEITDGIQYGELSIIGARPSQGKTALATTIVHHACLGQKLPTLFVTLEMSIPALCRRILSRHCRIGMKELKGGRFNESDFNRFALFHSTISQSPIYFLDSISGTNVSRVVGNIKRVVKSSGVKLVVVDYLQKIHSNGKYEKRTYEVAEVSTALKAVAVETGAAVLALAQLNREPDKEKSRLPRISDLADSAQIERDADLICLLYRDRAVNDGRDASLIVAKQRDGELGTCDLHFQTA